MLYHRIVEHTIRKLLAAKEAIILYGPRRTGKTTLFETLLKELQAESPAAFFSLDDPGAKSVFGDFTVARLESIFKGLGFNPQSRNYLFLDEILFFDHVDLLLKLIIDRFPFIKVLASSSSSILLQESLSESLAGRKHFIELLPLSLGEVFDLQVENFFYFEDQPLAAPRLKAAVQEIIIFGSYPEVVILAGHEEKRAKLRDIVESALFKDLFLLEGIRHPKALTGLLSLLAHQVGALVNINEIAATLGISRRIVDEYLGFLEKFFVIFRLVPFSRNPRSEIGSRFKAYFWDPGIRNSIINRFEPIEGRDDRGALLENLIISGIARRNLYSGRPYRHYYWQSYAGYEVDCVLDAVEKRELVALEIKYQGKGRITRAFDKYNPDRTIIAGFHDSYRYCL